ncbi:HAD-IIA family hydrolase [uncultured Nocardioides sp.]|uniref:HAD-IIA family hydrolase n=1 Tax=uncultured Nocardioides sp. TaxID=198441 RepID=UPI0026208A64|nr:HAD-IIA family hydrolase [uncultured Nocardioides sp.]
MLPDSPPLVETHDLVMLDLDGVVYVGPDPVPGAADHLAAARDAGARLAFVTNNASRPAAVVAERLTGFGVPAEVDDVVTSAQASARLVVDEHGEGARVLLLGGEGLDAAVREVGLEPVGLDGDPVVLLTGYGPDVLWSDIMSAAVAVEGGLAWVASNTDHTIPTARGRAPGHGVLVDMLRRYTGVEPTVAGKPQPPLLHETIRRVGGERPLMVGDRVDTDIEGAHAVGVDSLLVLTGVTGLPELAGIAAEHRPTHLAPDLGGLHEPHRAPRRGDDGWEADGWTATVTDGSLAVSGDGGDADWWRTAACALWEHLDEHGSPADVDGVTPPGR